MRLPELPVIPSRSEKGFINKSRRKGATFIEAGASKDKSKGLVEFYRAYRESPTGDVLVATLKQKIPLGLGEIYTAQQFRDVTVPRINRVSEAITGRRMLQD